MRGPDHISGDTLGDPARPAPSQRSRVARLGVMKVLAAAARRRAAGHVVWDLAAGLLPPRLPVLRVEAPVEDAPGSR